MDTTCSVMQPEIDFIRFFFLNKKIYVYLIFVMNIRDFQMDLSGATSNQNKQVCFALVFNLRRPWPSHKAFYVYSFTFQKVVIP